MYCLTPSGAAQRRARAGRRTRNAQHVHAGYSAFDPLLTVLHSNVGRLWKIWQKLRHKPFNFARCANRALYKPLEPFSYDTQNHDPVTRSNALPVHLFDTAKFHYHFDNLDLNGDSVTQINEMIERRKANARFYAGFVPQRQR